MDDEGFRILGKRRRQRGHELAPSDRNVLAGYLEDFARILRIPRVLTPTVVVTAWEHDYSGTQFNGCSCLARRRLLTGTADGSRHESCAVNAVLVPLAGT